MENKKYRLWIVSHFDAPSSWSIGKIILSVSSHRGTKSPFRTWGKHNWFSDRVSKAQSESWHQWNVSPEEWAYLRTLFRLNHPGSFSGFTFLYVLEEDFFFWSLGRLCSFLPLYVSNVSFTVLNIQPLKKDSELISEMLSSPTFARFVWIYEWGIV